MRPTKATIVHMTKWIGNELAADDTTALTLGPGFARSETAELLSDKVGIDVAMAQPVEVAARAVRYLATCRDPLQYPAPSSRPRDSSTRSGCRPPETHPHRFSE